MHHDIEFESAGVTLRGWFFAPENRGPAPCIVLVHGFSGVKEMHLDEFARVFQAAGLACVAYDHPGFGASDAYAGTPRQEIDPWQQARAMQDAITFAQSRPEVDPGRIGVWGSSFGGGLAFVVAAIDKRVKAVCGQVPMISGHRNFQALVRCDFWEATWQGLAYDRQARARGEAPAMVPVVDENPMSAAVIPSPDGYAFFTRVAAERAPSWRNEVTLRSLEAFQSFEPADFLARISPVPLLMIVAVADRLAPTEFACAAYESAHEPKDLRFIPGGHFDAYEGDVFEQSSSAARDFFVRHLLADLGHGAAAQPVSGAV
ncbi:alpha/beta fold hydrolase [Mycobacterium sp. OAE908]|uniref:alpha/beta hydrolase n=1 Tax=Mycobacterium sp. OAE908 TaxID=2817899 RepID=UPI001AE17707